MHLWGGWTCNVVFSGDLQSLERKPMLSPETTIKHSEFDFETDAERHVTFP